MYGMVIDPGWREYYANSPYNNLLNSSHGNFQFFEVSRNQGQSDPEEFEKILACDGLVVSTGLEVNLRPIFDGPILSIGDDMHRFDEEGLGALVNEVRGCDFYLTPYSLTRTQTEYPYHYLPGWMKATRLILYPNCAPSPHLRPRPPSTQRPRGFLTGQVSQPYPLRMKIREHGADLLEELPFRAALGQDYFHLLSEYAVGLTCNLWLDSTVAKYYEIPWAGSLLMAPLPFDALERQLLGFRDGINMVAISEMDFSPNPEVFRSKLREALEDGSMASVRDAGTRLVLEHHTVESRLIYLERLLDAICAGAFHVDDQFDIFASTPPVVDAARPRGSAQ